MSTTSYYRLRPVSGISPSPSPTASTTPQLDDHSPHYKQSRTSSPAALPTCRRPMSPSSLKELDLSHSSCHTPPRRKYPAPPTGHDLMAMFPPASPNNFEMLSGHTNDFFKRQERAFFAQAGVRARVEVDFPHGSEPDIAKQPASQPWLINSPGPGPSSSTAHSPGQWPPAPLHPQPGAATRPAPMSVPVNPSLTFPPLFTYSKSPTSNPPPSNFHPPVLHQTTSGLQTPPDDITPPISIKEYEPDESWRRPMPYAERRRAGKHTRRVILRT